LKLQLKLLQNQDVPPPGGAIISPCGQYRYHLHRNLCAGPQAQVSTCLFIMLNPSTADGTEDDPTIRRCMNYAAAWGHTRLEVVNLFSYRATNPKDLPIDATACGPEHVEYFMDAVFNADAVVCAWGRLNHPLAKQLAEGVIETLGLAEVIAPAMCLATNQDGSPVHPLYQKADLTPIPYGVTSH
jgi:hypothetical protein|tara:strand:+ start:1214 stop:1768 length:555 start_codon:yes stop_codon:yes gene_type:complete